MPEPLLALFAAAYAGAFASFVGVVIDRVPSGRPLHGPSRCQCGTPVRWRHNIPGLSWLWLQGQAACCDATIPRHLWALEAFTMLLAGTLAWWSVPVAAAATAGWLAAVAAVGVAHGRKAAAPLQR